MINMNFHVPVFQLLSDPSTYCKFKRLAINPQCMTLLVKIMPTIVEKNFFTLINVGACLYVLEWRSLFFKEMNMFFRVKFQIQACSAQLKLLNQYGCQNTCVPENIFSLYVFSLN